MKFVLKFERCTSACYPYNVALAWIKFHTPVGFPFFQAVKIILLLPAIALRFYGKVNDSVIGKRRTLDLNIAWEIINKNKKH